MRKGIFLVAVMCIVSFGCATQADYKLHAFYKSKNNSLSLVSKLAIYKSGNYSICTSTLDHEIEPPGEGSYSCIEGIWTQQKNKVSLTANTYEGKAIISFPEHESNAILERIENLANPTTLSILQPSGVIVSDISVTEGTTRKVNSWSNYQNTESP
jgi:C4-type Zn-finger protein